MIHRLYMFLTILSFYLVAGADPVPEDTSWLREECGDGALAWQDRNGNVYLTELVSGKHEKLGKGSRPEFSPDSGKLAWIRGDQAVGRLRKGTPTVHVIAENVEPIGGVHWISNNEVVVLQKGRKWHRVKLDGTSRPVPGLDKLGRVERECDIKLRTDGTWAMVSGRTWKTTTGRKGRIPGRCSVSLSPDGRSITSLHPGHKSASLTAIEKGGQSGKLKWVYTGARRNKGFDNHRWSSNDPRYVVVLDEATKRLAVMRIRKTRAVVVGGEGGEYGDFTVGDGKTSPWPTAGKGGSDTNKSQSQDAPKPVRRNVVLAVLKAKSVTPDPDNYPDALAVYRYQVKRILSGKLKARDILVVHWAVADGKELTSLTGREIGKVFRMTIEDFDAHPKLAEHRRAELEDPKTMDMSLWVEIPGR